jgi:predicted Rossmann fold flavoprotein
LVALCTKNEVVKELNGLNLKNVQINLWVDGKKKAQEFGEMTFTEFGFSGPIVLTLSRVCIADIEENRKVIFSIDLKPALDDNQLDTRLLRDLNEQGKIKFRDFLKGLLPIKLTEVCCSQIAISGDKLCNQISANERKKLRIWLKDFRFEVSAARPFTEAIITQGGIELKEVETKTMESKLIKNLYFAGELLDVDANTGGYNLQIAFSTACLASQGILTKLG